jgi:hypothetical protein
VTERVRQWLDDESGRRKPRTTWKTSPLLSRDAAAGHLTAGQQPERTMTMQTQTFKQAAHALVDTLPDDASWRELAYLAALRASIEQGLSEANARELITQDDIEREFRYSG